MEVIWEELGSKFKDLLKVGKSGVIASLIAASQRLHIYEHKVRNEFVLLFIISLISPRYLCILNLTYSAKLRSPPPTKKKKSVGLQFY